MNKPYLADISDLTRLLLVFGLLVAVSAQVISHMLSRRGRAGLRSRFLAIAAVGVLAVVGLIAKPELGGAFADFCYTALGRVVPRIGPKSPDAPQSKVMP